MTLLLRVAETGDLDAIVTLNGEIQAHHAALHPDFFDPMTDRPAVRALFQRLLSDKAQRIWVAAEDRAVGYLWAEWIEAHQGTFSHRPDRLLIHHIGVARTHRRQGAARLLMGQAISHAGTAPIELTSWSANTGAHRFFETMGFAPLSATFLRRAPADVPANAPVNTPET